MENPYPLALVPGKSRVIQLLNPNSTPYQIPSGTTITGRVVNVLQEEVCDLNVVINDGTQGLISVGLPDSAEVAAYYSRTVYYSLKLEYQGGSGPRYLPISTLNIDYSPAHV